MTNYSRSVLKSNGIHRSENLPVKFVFSSKTVPANISQKLPSQAKVGTHSPLPTGSYTAAHTPKQGCFGRGWYYYPRTVSHVSETLRGQGVERQTLPLLGLGRVCSRRTQKAYGTAMCLCASLSRRRRGPAGLRRPTPPAERTVLAPISPRVQLCLRRPAFPLSAFIPGA